MFRSDKRTARANIKKTIDAEDARRKREETSVELRRVNRAEQITSKRRITPSTSTTTTTSSSSNAPIAGETELMKQFRTAHDVKEKLAMLPTILIGFNSTNPSSQYESTQLIRKLLSIEKCPPINEIIQTGALPRLVTFLSRHEMPLLQFEAAWALTNIASGTSSHTKLVIDHGAIPLLIDLLRSPNEDVREQCIWALGNISGDTHSTRDTVLRAGVMQPLLSLLTSDAKLPTLKNIAWTISNLCRGKPQPSFDMVKGCLPALRVLLTHTDEDVLADTCWALSYLSDDSGSTNTKIGAVIASGVVPRLVELLQHPNVSVKTPSLRAIGNLVTGDDTQTQAVMDYPILMSLGTLLKHPKKGIRKEACWTISNITAGNNQQIHAVLQANLVAPLLHMITNEEFEVAKEAIWAISNATSGGTPQHLHYIVQQGMIPAFVAMMDTSDAKLLMVVLEGLENVLRMAKQSTIPGVTLEMYSTIMEESDGIDALEALQRHENTAVYDRTVSMLKEFFDADENEQVMDAPTVTADATQFSFGSSMNGFGTSSSNNGGFNFGSTTQQQPSFTFNPNASQTFAF